MSEGPNLAALLDALDEHAVDYLIGGSVIEIIGPA